MSDLPRRIWQARDAGGLLARADTQPVTSRAAAYAVQADAVAASGLTRAGWKVAATSSFAQQLLAMEGPSLGPVFGEFLFDAPCTVAARPEQSTAVECEFAFVMARDLDESEPSRDAVLAVTDHALIAVEIVGCRFEGGIKDAGSLLCISDFSFGASLVRGPMIGNWRDIDLAAATAAADVNGVRMNEGTGAAVLGNPLDALHWAAVEAAAIGLPLRAGDIISTGTMTGATAVKPGDKMVGDFGPLGRIAIEFNAG